jgi:hypothetical protein
MAEKETLTSEERALLEAIKARLSTLGRKFPDREQQVLCNSLRMARRMFNEAREKGRPHPDQVIFTIVTSALMKPFSDRAVHTDMDPEWMGEFRKLALAVPYLSEVLDYDPADAGREASTTTCPMCERTITPMLFDNGRGCCVLCVSSIDAIHAAPG